MQRGMELRLNVRTLFQYSIYVYIFRVIVLFLSLFGHEESRLDDITRTRLYLSVIRYMTRQDSLIPS